MSSPFANYPVPERSFIPQAMSRAASSAPTKPPAQKRGRKPKNSTASAAQSPVASQGSLPSNQPAPLQWSAPQTSAGAGPSTPASVTMGSPTSTTAGGPDEQMQLVSETGTVLSLPGVVLPAVPPTAAPSAAASPRHSVPATGAPGGEEDVEGEDEILPAMADDDYSAQLSWQSQSKDNLK